MPTTTEIEGLDALGRLEERILETVNQLRAERGEKEEAHKEAAALRERLHASEQKARQLAADLDAYRLERRQIAERLEKLLAQIDLLSQG